MHCEVLGAELRHIKYSRHCREFGCEVKRIDWLVVIAIFLLIYNTKQKTPQNKKQPPAISCSKNITKQKTVRYAGCQDVFGRKKSPIKSSTTYIQQEAKVYR
jgi:hypothetical protein